MKARQNTIKGLVFDKDGTLFDFNATWGQWASTMLETEAAGNADVFQKLAARLGFDPVHQRFLQGSIVIAETIEVVADAIIEVLPERQKTNLIADMQRAATSVPQVQTTPLVAFFNSMQQRGLKLGVATNDNVASARAHLSAAGVETVFDFIAGYDSGFGGKPEAGQLFAFCETLKLPPESCAMVGDSTHDLIAARAAGMISIGVLTGPARKSELQPFADVVLNSIAELSDWLDVNEL